MKIEVTAKPQAKSQSVEPINRARFKVAVKEPARAGQANAAVIRAIARYFGVAASRVKIISGHGSRRKFIEIHQ